MKKKYYDICLEMGARGPYLADEIGKCQRHVRAYQGTGKSRIDKYLLESATYSASLTKRCLDKEFNKESAISGVLEWIESRKNENRKNDITNVFPVQVDEAHGIVKQAGKERYGLLEDVMDCLFRTSQEGTMIRWGESKSMPTELWQEPSLDDITMADSSMTTFGTQSQSRFWQAYWRKRVEALWGENCIITGCSNRTLLRAAHIKRVSVSTTEERHDENNGLILSGNIDLAFEHGLISFSDSGEMLFSQKFSIQDRERTGFPSKAKLPSFTKSTQLYLQWHRDFHKF